MPLELILVFIALGIAIVLAFATATSVMWDAIKDREWGVAINVSLGLVALGLIILAITLKFVKDFL